MKLVILLLVLALAAVGLALHLMRGGGPGLQPGDPAPPFELPGSDGRTHRLSDLRGKTVVLAWFPKAFTGG
jgi:peroxiredoxin Q/BCP